MTPKLVHVIGGGTISHMRSHLALCAPAYGTTARKIAELAQKQSNTMDVVLHLTKLSDKTSVLETNDDLKKLVLDIVDDMKTKILFWNPALVDFDGTVGKCESGKYAARLHTRDSDGNNQSYQVTLSPSEKLVTYFRNGSEGRKPRKDIFLVSFKTTSGATPREQYLAGLNLLKQSSSNLVLANDIKTRLNMVIVPEEAVYHQTTNRDEALRGLVEMTYLRSHLTFTKSTVVAGVPIPWESDLIPPTLRAIVDHCIYRGAYKKFRGVTAGHFAVKLDDTTFLTSRRKTDFNDMKHVGLVKIKTDGPDSVIAYGSKPSVGGQSQRIVFTDHPEADCIVHFHCPIKPESLVPIVSQREFECGSHECGKNTSKGLKQFGNLSVIYLDQHGPNIIFNKSIDPIEVINFIEHNFNLEEKTGGYSIS